MRTLLEMIRTKRAEAMEEAEEKGLGENDGGWFRCSFPPDVVLVSEDEYETDNLMWQKTHENFRTVMHEMTELSKVLKRTDGSDKPVYPTHLRHVAVETDGKLQEVEEGGMADFLVLSPFRRLNATAIARNLTS